MKSINVREDFDPETMTSPMPLQAILLTNDHIKEAMKRQSKSFRGRVDDPAHRESLQSLLSTGFDDILTTNYSYELEETALGVAEISESQLKRINKRTSKNAERVYLLHTYNSVRYNEVDNRIWHIHGESRKPDSMILGHYWYGNLLGRIKAELERGGNQYYQKQKRQETIRFDSWVDSFILGDVYVLGFSFDFSEMDLWWLLNRKYREKAEKGRLVFYEMKNAGKREKTELLRLLGAEIVDLGFTEPERNDPGKYKIYRQFYRQALADIKDRVNNSRGEQ